MNVDRSKYCSTLRMPANVSEGLRGPYELNLLSAQLYPALIAKNVFYFLTPMLLLFPSSFFNLYFVLLLFFHFQLSCLFCSLIFNLACLCFFQFLSLSFYIHTHFLFYTYILRVGCLSAT
jgi:hypothetical protein